MHVDAAAALSLLSIHARACGRTCQVPVAGEEPERMTHACMHACLLVAGGRMDKKGRSRAATIYGESSNKANRAAKASGTSHLATKKKENRFIKHDMAQAGENATVIIIKKYTFNPINEFLSSGTSPAGYRAH